MKTSYIATLGIRPAEMKALEELPGKTKARLTPLVLLAPWSGTSPLERALDRVEKAYPKRSYFVDLDWYYKVEDPLSEAKKQWNEIRYGSSRLNTWWSVLKGYPYACPCLLIDNMSIDDVRRQINWARENSREFCIKIGLDTRTGSGIPLWMDQLLVELEEEGTGDYTVLFEFGFVHKDFQIPDNLFEQILEIFRRVPYSVPVAVSFTSFPNSFKDYDDIEECTFNNRDVMIRISQRTNHPAMIYCDWASTRPRNDGERFGNPKNRIDYPIDRSWIIARDEKQNGEFRDLARRIVQSDYWDDDLGIWGAELIKSCASGSVSAITANYHVRVARINIHLHRQAFFGHLPRPEELDEKWKDDDL